MYQPAYANIKGLLPNPLFDPPASHCPPETPSWRTGEAIRAGDFSSTFGNEPRTRTSSMRGKPRTRTSSMRGKPREKSEGIYRISSRTFFARRIERGARPSQPKRLLRRSRQKGRKTGFGSRPKKGFTVIPVILIVGAVTIVIGTFILFVGTNFIDNFSSLQKSYKAHGLVNACIEEALVKIQQSSFLGSGSLTIGADTCTYNIANTGGITRKVTASSSISSVVRKAEINLNVNTSTLGITWWQEVSDF